MGNSKKGTAVEEKVVFTGNQQDFEKFRTWFHNEMDEKDRLSTVRTKTFEKIII